MGHLVYDTEVEPFEIEGERYDLKRKMSYRDRRILETEIMNLVGKVREGELVNVAKPTLLLLNIKGWSLKDDGGQLLPITSKNIDLLDGNIAEAIGKEIDRRNTRPKA